MDGLENRVENLVWRLQREIADFRSDMNAGLDSLQEDLGASMLDIGVIKKEQGTQVRRIDLLEQQAGIGSRKFRQA